MVGWHHCFNGHGFGWTSGVGDGQGGLACCGSWGRKQLDMTEQLNWTQHKVPTYWAFFLTFPICFKCQITIEQSTLSSSSTPHSSFKRSSFDDCFQVVTVNFWWPVTMLIFKALISFAKCLELPPHYMFVSSFWDKCIADIVSCLHCFTIHLNSNDKIVQICFLHKHHFHSVK